MTALLWTAALLVGAALVWTLIKVGVGFFTPPEVTGNAYLRQALKKRGISPNEVPHACVFEFVAFAEKTARFGLLTGEKFTTKFVEGLDLMADIIEAWTRGSESNMFEDAGESRNPYKDILERHSVRRNAGAQMSGHKS